MKDYNKNPHTSLEKGRFVLCKEDKTPIHSDWLNSPKSLADAQIHKGLIGIIPSSLNSICIDIDEGDSDAFVEQFGEPYFQYKTRRNHGRHLWYFDKGNRGNLSFKNIGGCNGDVRQSKGYAIVWSKLEHLEFMLTQEIENNVLSQEFFTLLNQEAPKDDWKERNNTLNRQLYKCFSDGTISNEDREELVERILDKARATGLPEKEIQATYKSAMKAGTNTRKQRNNQTKNIYQLFDQHIKREGFEIGYDGTINSNVIRPVGSRNLTDWKKINKQVIDNFLSNFNKRMSERDVGIYLNSYGRRIEFNSFIEYLENIKDTESKENNGTAAIMQLFQQCYGAPDTPLTQQAGQIFVCSIIARQLYQKVQTRICPVLIGEQKQGKSLLGTWLLPDFLQEYAKQDFSISENDRDNVLAIQGSLIIELGELAGSRRFNDRLKGFLTRTHDTINPKFSNQVERFPRRSVFYATSNSLNPYPTDDSGHSRFVPIECNNEGGSQAKEWLETNRDLIFATGYKLVKDFHKCDKLHKLLELEDEQLAAQKELNRQFEFNPNSILDGLVGEYLQDFEKWEFDQLTTFVRERIKQLRETQSLGSVGTRNGDFTKALNRLGWRRRKGPQRNEWVKE